MKDIDWSKAPEECVGCLVELRGNGRIFPSEVEQSNSKTIQFRGKKFSGECLVSEWKFYPRPAVLPWSGAGLPPVGTVCEVDYCEEWHQCEIIAHFDQRCGRVAAFTVQTENLAKSLDAFGAEHFRPIRTAEQIAAEYRRAAVLEMKGHLSFSDYLEAERHCEQLYDAGYRKQVQP